MSRNIGLVHTIGADAVGRPGQRRFRLFMQGSSSSAFLWMDKEQLRALSEALDRSLALLTDGQILRTEASVNERREIPGLPVDFPAAPTYDTQVGQMRLSYDEGTEYFLLYAVPIEAVLENEESQLFVNEEDLFSCAFTRQQAQELSRVIIDLIAAGRPVCPLCHAPLDGGPHACVKQNGHRDIVRIEEVEDE
ncbi:DUF3090 family protein [Tengunoibacter tsumagoiensis]|uniref:DUF3090 family protein n=1 Tax=Tengunoibacter tsumagoiensis TaxID=2014871 RepID=A0A402A579_9CHLR|nr:DUF3090 family protein [Tengunoibacter tsumagoiensis]GCE14304.1 hypothetical protein KTT_41630 [Tengunoibacter tsumagoiensis]